MPWLIPIGSLVPPKSIAPLIAVAPDFNVMFVSPATVKTIELIEIFLVATAAITSISAAVEMSIFAFNISDTIVSSGVGCGGCGGPGVQGGIYIGGITGSGVGVGVGSTGVGVGSTGVGVGSTGVGVTIGIGTSGMSGHGSRDNISIIIGSCFSISHGTSSSNSLYANIRLA